MAYKKQGGIYKITCSINNKIYIGSTNSFSERKYHHFHTLENNTHRNTYLQRAYNKYGCECFEFSIIEVLNENDKINNREIYWIKTLDSFKNGFNLTEGGERWIPSESTKLKRSKSLMGSKNPMFGRVGSKNPNAKLNEDTVILIKQELKNNISDKEIIERYNLGLSQFYKIKCNRTWKHI